MLEKLKQPQVIALILTLVFQGFEQFGVVVPQPIVANIMDLATILAGGLVAYKSQKDSLV